MKIYAIGGLGADKRVFQNLSIYNEITFLEWIKPKDNESIEHYAKRLSASIVEDEKFVLIGVSFGGLIAVEIHKIIPAQKVLLISSIETRIELPLLYKAVGLTKILSIVPQIVFNKTKMLGRFFFGAEDTDLLLSILKETNPRFLKWALNTIVSWENTTSPPSVVRIHGNSDMLFPGDLNSCQYVIKGGKHFMIVDKAGEIDVLIEQTLASL